MFWSTCIDGNDLCGWRKFLEYILKLWFYFKFMVHIKIVHEKVHFNLKDGPIVHIFNLKRALSPGTWSTGGAFWLIATCQEVYEAINRTKHSKCELCLTHFCPPFRFRNQVPTFAVRETDVSRHNGGTSGAPLQPLRDDSVLRALSSAC